MIRTFDITPASATALIVISVFCVLLLLILGFFTFVGYSARKTKFEVTEQGLRIKGSLYGRFIPREVIAGEKIQILNLTADPAFQPRIRTNGIGLPGYAAGWFKLKNNEKALLFVTDRANVVYIPTKQDYSVLLSISNPEEFYQSIKLWQ